MLAVLVSMGVLYFLGRDGLVGLYSRNQRTGGVCREKLPAAGYKKVRVLGYQTAVRAMDFSKSKNSSTSINV